MFNSWHTPMLWKSINIIRERGTVLWHSKLSVCDGYKYVYRNPFSVRWRRLCHFVSNSNFISLIWRYDNKLPGKIDKLITFSARIANRELSKQSNKKPLDKRRKVKIPALGAFITMHLKLYFGIIHHSSAMHLLSNSMFPFTPELSIRPP